MAKKNVVENIVRIGLGSVIGIPTDNCARLASGLFASKKEQSELVSSLITGYESSMGLIRVYELSDIEKAQANAYALKRIADFENEGNGSYTCNIATEANDKGSKQVVITGYDLAKYARSIYGDKPNIKYGVVSGFRRTDSWLLVQCFQHNHNLPLSELWPVEVCDYASVDDRRMATLQENLLKKIGNKELSQADIVRAAWEMEIMGRREIDFRRIFKDGTGQKLKAAMTIIKETNGANPPITIDDFCANIGGKDAKYQFGAMTRVGLLAQSGKPVDEIEKYFCCPNPDKKNETKIMKKDDIESLGKCGIGIIKQVIDGILSNDPSCLSKLIPQAAKINELLKDL